MVEKRCQHKTQKGIQRKDGDDKGGGMNKSKRWTCSINKTGDHIGHCQSVPVKLIPYYSTWGALALTTFSFIDRWSTKPINLSSPLSLSPAPPFTSPFRPAPGGRGWHNLSLSSGIDWQQSEQWAWIAERSVEEVALRPPELTLKKIKPKSHKQEPKHLMSITFYFVGPKELFKVDNINKLIIQKNKTVSSNLKVNYEYRTEKCSNIILQWELFHWTPVKF